MNVVKSLRIVALLLFLLLVAGLAYLPTGYASDVAGKVGLQGVVDANLGEDELLQVALTYLRENRADFGLTEGDLADVVLKDQYRSQHNGVTHIYLRQRLNGIEVFNADINVNIASDGQIINVNNRFVPNLAESLGRRTARQATISASEAVGYAAEALQLTIRESLKTRQRRGGETDEVLLSDGGISQQDIPAKLIYQPLEDGTVRLAWDVEIDEISGENYWSVRVDAQNGELLDTLNWVIHDEWHEATSKNTPPEAPTEPYPAPEAPSEPSPAYPYPAPYPDPAPYPAPAYPAPNTGYPSPNAPYLAPETTLRQAQDTASVVLESDQEETTEAVTTLSSLQSVAHYRVFAQPLISPYDGPRSLVSDPADATASPFGWHDIDGVAGADYTTTRGNNVHAYEDGNHRGYSPDGGADLAFDFPLDLTQAPDAYEEAAITNLFYWSNVIHDVLYQYGFDEESGNFQQNNYGKGGSGQDYLLAEAQHDNGLNNATFFTPPDGRTPRLQVNLLDVGESSLDGGFDSSLILHEYGHGVSTRLTGGRYNIYCLSNAEQGGEGWSDWFALALTAQASDQQGDARGMATYTLNQPPTGAGIRLAPYTTDMSVNGYTYGDISRLRAPHGVGFVWGTMLWEMYWQLVQAHGFDADLYHGTGGNNIALQLVMDGLKLQPCDPGFVEARDAILLADKVNHEGANQCLLWQAFAKRGLGVSANQAHPNDITDGQEAFDLPPDCQIPAQAFHIPLTSGWNLISLPLQPLPAETEEGSQPERQIGELLASIDGKYEQVHAYDGCNESQPWQQYDPNAPRFANSLQQANENMGLWINMSVADTLVVTGTMPLTSTISLCNGWNLVGYPSLKEAAITDALKPIEGAYMLVNGYQASDGTDRWQKFDLNAPIFANTLHKMQPGKGYWIEVEQEVEWVMSHP